MKEVNKKEIPQAVREYLSMNGSKGGSVKSEKKAAAVRRNGCAPCRPGRFRGRPPKKSNENKADS